MLNKDEDGAANKRKRGRPQKRSMDVVKEMQTVGVPEKKVRMGWNEGRWPAVVTVLAHAHCEQSSNLPPAKGFSNVSLNYCKSWTVCAILKIPVVSERSDSVLSADIRVIKVITRTASQQHQEEEGRKRVRRSCAENWHVWHFVFAVVYFCYFKFDWSPISKRARPAFFQHLTKQGFEACRAVQSGLIIHSGKRCIKVSSSAVQRCFRGTQNQAE